MHGAHVGAKSTKRLEDTGVERTAGVQDDAPLQLFRSDARQLGGNTGELRIKRGNQNQ
jgi:hypothetical protein